MENKEEEKDEFLEVIERHINKNDDTYLLTPEYKLAVENLIKRIANKAVGYNNETVQIYPKGWWDRYEMLVNKLEIPVEGVINFKNGEMRKDLKIKK